MMVHHDDHYRPFPSIELVAGGSGDGDGPSAGRCISNNDIYHVFGGGGSAVASGAAPVGGSAVGTRTLQQPFAISPIESTVTAFRSPGARGGGMAASWECPFTNAQWKELERQAMIYKYMVAAVPVPPHLLIPIPRSLPSDSAASFPPLGNNAGLSLKFTNEADQEPGRCRRTDGKKWRCSRDAAPPNRKYCERHMHRSRPRPRPRPRSRKPVELHAIAKKTRSNPTISAAERPFTAAAISSPTVNSSNNNGAGSQFVSEPYLQNLVFLDKSNDQAANLNANQPFASAYKDPRGLNWTVAETGQQWHDHAVPTQIDIPGKSSLINEPTVVNQHYQEEEALNLNSVGDMGSAEDQRKAQYPMYLEEAPPRGFIDAWSIGESDEQNASARDTISGCVSSKGKFSTPSLDLSMGSDNSMDNEMDHIQMGLSLIESNKSHKCGTPGGPLGEVLQPRTATTTSNNQSYFSGNSPPATTVSSPSGVLQKNLASFSDSSGNSSPTTTTTLAAAGSMARPEIALMW